MSTGGIESALAIATPIFLTLIFTLQVRVLLTNILEEKEAKLAALLKMSGLSEDVWLASWYITPVAKSLVLLTAVAVVTCTAGLFRDADFSVVWVLFLLFELTIVGYGVAAAALFNQAATGGIIGMALYLAAAIPSYGFITGATPPAAKIALSLLAPFGFNLGVNIIMAGQVARVPLTWAAAGDASLAPAGVPLAAVMGMLALDAVVYGAAAWYLHKVVPTEFGVARHPLFCCGFRRTVRRLSPAKAVVDAAIASPDTVAVDARRLLPSLPSPSQGGGGSFVGSGGGGGGSGSGSTDDERLIALLRAESAAVEDVTPDVAGRPGVFLHHLSKVFPMPHGGAHVAVDNLSLELYEGQVLCLLGHNGARAGGLLQHAIYTQHTIQ